jgi:predicted ester cyclase
LKARINISNFLWLFLIIMLACEQSFPEEMVKFAEGYTDAWNSNDPDKMASFFAEDGQLIINEGTPAQGRTELSATAQSFMEAFPDMHLTLDSLVADNETYRYHWTFTGTNTGSGGTGNSVVFSGFERWTMNEEGLIQYSIGTFDAEDYNRQLQGE